MIGVSSVWAKTSYQAAYDAYAAIDGIVAGNTGWIDNASLPTWWQVQFVSAQAVTSYAIVRNDSFPNRNIKDFTFQGSNDGVAWVTLDTQVGITWPTAGQTQTFTIPNTTTYLYYRVYITANNGDSYTTIMEINLGGIVASPQTPYEAAVLADSPWGFWEFPNSIGNRLYDSSVSNHNLLINGSAGTLGQMGPFGSKKSIVWAAVNGYAASADTVATSDATMEAWVYLTANPSADTSIMGHAAGFNSSTRDKTIYVDTLGRVCMHFYPGVVTVVTASSPLTLNQWHHIVGSVGAAGAKIRVDKVTVGTNVGTTSYTGVQMLFIRGGGDIFNGNGAMRIAAAARYVTQLSDARTDAHYDAGIAEGAPVPIPVISHSASGSYDIYVPNNAFDGDVSTAWVVLSPSGWLETSFTLPVILTGYAISAHANPNQVPKNWTFEGSNDGTTWFVLDTRTNQSIGSWGVASYSFANTVAYLNCRINVSATLENTVTIAELSMVYTVQGSAPAPVANLVATSTLTAAASASTSGVANLVATSTLTAAGVIPISGVVPLTAASSMSTTAVSATLVGASLLAASSLTAAAVNIGVGAANLSATSTLTVVGGPTTQGAGVLSAASILSATGVVGSTISGAAVLIAASILSATGSTASSAVAAGVLSAASILSVTGVVASSAAVALVAASTLGATEARLGDLLGVVTLSAGLGFSIVLGTPIPLGAVSLNVAPVVAAAVAWSGTLANPYPALSSDLKMVDLAPAFFVATDPVPRSGSATAPSIWYAFTEGQVATLLASSGVSGGANLEIYSGPQVGSTVGSDLTLIAFDAVTPIMLGAVAISAGLTTSVGSPMTLDLVATVSAGLLVTANLGF